MIIGRDDDSYNRRRFHYNKLKGKEREKDGPLLLGIEITHLSKIRPLPYANYEGSTTIALLSHPSFVPNLKLNSYEKNRYTNSHFLLFK